jgi:two-component system response regulator
MTGVGPANASGPAVLLVEDNPDDEELTRRAFAACGLLNELVVARDGVEALDFLLRRGVWAARPEAGVPLVLLDLKLPKVDGHEVLRRMRADPRTNLVPVVVLTSSDEERDLVASYASGANAFVRKPVALGDFMAAVRSLGLFWLILNRPPPVPGTALDRRPGDGA